MWEGGVPVNHHGSVDGPAHMKTLHIHQCVNPHPTGSTTIHVYTCSTTQDLKSRLHALIIHVHVKGF